MNILKDLKQKQALYIKDGANCSFAKVLFTDGTGAMVLYRLMRWFASNHLKPVAYLIQYLNKVINGCVIGVGAKFDEGLVLAHPIGVVINSKVVGGKNIIIESGVVVGDEKGLSPVLGDNIFIGAGAKIIGDVSIGSNSKIGANAVVVKSTPEGVTLLGIPARPYNSKEPKVF